MIGDDPAPVPEAADEAIRRRRAARTAFLKRLYTASEGDVGAFQDAREIGDQVGVPVAEAERIVRYFEDRGFLRQSGGGGLIVRLTAAGVDHVELGGRAG